MKLISSKKLVDGKFHLIQGKAGVGKTEFAKKLMRYCFSIRGIALGCAAKALTATIYIDYGFETTHSLSKIPVNIVEIHIAVVSKKYSVRLHGFNIKIIIIIHTLRLPRLKILYMLNVIHV